MTPIIQLICDFPTISNSKTQRKVTVRWPWRRQKLGRPTDRQIWVPFRYHLKALGGLFQRPPHFTPAFWPSPNCLRIWAQHLGQPKPQCRRNWNLEHCSLLSKDKPRTCCFCKQDSDRIRDTGFFLKRVLVVWGLEEEFRGLVLEKQQEGASERGYESRMCPQRNKHISQELEQQGLWGVYWRSDISKHTSSPALLGDRSPRLYLSSSEMDLVTLTWPLPAWGKEPMRKRKEAGWGGGLLTHGLWYPSPNHTQEMSSGCIQLLECLFLNQWNRTQESREGWFWLEDTEHNLFRMFIKCLPSSLLSKP